ncbi:MAG: class I SAM-dependent methyltransferase [Acidobacteriota bacterium]
MSFGPWLGWCRTAFLPKTAQSSHALTFGDGDGRFTAQLLALNPHICIEAIDGSPAMLARLEKNAGANRLRVRTVVADARTWKPHAGESFDLVYTHFFLDCLSDAEVCELVRRVARSLPPGAMWLVSEFAVPASGPGRFIGHPLVALLYRAFGLLTGLSVRRLPDHHAALVNAGFSLGAQRKWLLGVLVSECWTRQDPT